VPPAVPRFSAGRTLKPAMADTVFAGNGVNSVLPKQFYPVDDVAFAGINIRRGVTCHKSFLTGQTYTRTGSILTGKMVIYSTIDDVDGEAS
jgi:hypothetical protein